ncbi:MAG: hypothetical protein KF724_10020 [Phycisphaeraceae bacterium]|nr:hypothetical protein [Phycisphaeraceae bacterium]
MLTPLPTPFGLFAMVALMAVMVLVAMTGGMLIARALRGRSIGVTPFCTRCRFDLRGMTLEATSRCPECGKMLAGHVEVGPRRVRVRSLITGVLLVLVAAVVMVGTPLDFPRRANAWIVNQRSLGSFAGALERGDERAWTIAFTRMRDGQLSPSDLEWLLDRSLRSVVATGVIGNRDHQRINRLMAEMAPPTGDAATDTSRERLIAQVLETLSDVPGAVVLMAHHSQEPRFLRETLVFTASLSNWPALTTPPASLRIVDLIGPDQASMPEIEDPRSSPPEGGSSRSLRVVLAPEGGDEVITVRAIIEIRAGSRDDGTPLWIKSVERSLPMRLRRPPPP